MKRPNRLPYSPLAARLARLRGERDRLAEQLTDAELELASLQAALNHFKVLYLKRLGALLLELEQLETALARCCAVQHPEDAAAQIQVFANQERARKTAEDLHDAEAQQTADARLTSAEFKQAYRKVVSALHPDRASDAQDAALRTQLMVVANQALRAGDRAQLEHLLDEYALRRSPLHYAPPEEQLAQVERQLAHLRRQLGGLRIARARLKDDSLYRLMEQMQLQAQPEGDPWQKVAQELRLRVQLAQRLLDRWLHNMPPRAASAGKVSRQANKQARAAQPPAKPRRRAAAAPTPRPAAQYFTQEGVAVRSPTELLIAQTLTQAGLAYVYEYQPADAALPLGGFVIWGAQQQAQVWEHAGPDWAERLQYYVGQGLQPGVSLFVTHDEPGGGLDMRQFLRIIHYLKSTYSAG